MWKGPAHVPMDHDTSFNVKKQMERSAVEAPLLCVGAGHRNIAPGYTTSQRHRAAAGGWARPRELLCVTLTPKNTGPANREVQCAGTDRHKIGRPRRDLRRRPPGRPDRDDELSRARYAFRLETKNSIDLSLDSERAREKYHGRKNHCRANNYRRTRIRPHTCGGQPKHCP